jgi:hypothetical protein
MNLIDTIQSATLLVMAVWILRHQLIATRRARFRSIDINSAYPYKLSGYYGGRLESNEPNAKTNPGEGQ